MKNIWTAASIYGPSVLSQERKLLAAQICSTNFAYTKVTMSPHGTILLTGGTGKVSSRIATLLSANGNSTLIASRSGTTAPLPHCRGVKFDWYDSATWPTAFSNATVTAAFLVAPPDVECAPPVNKFIDFAIERGVKRFVLMSASLLPVEDGPMMSQISKYLLTLDIEYAILRPTWFMGRFSNCLCV